MKEGHGHFIFLIKFESPTPKDALGQIYLKLAQWFWIRKTCQTFTVTTLTTATTHNGLYLIRKPNELLPKVS